MTPLKCYFLLHFVLSFFVCYRLQCSYGKVMFLHLFVILSIGGGVWQTSPGRHPPCADPPTPCRHPHSVHWRRCLADTPRQTSTLGRPPQPRADTPTPAQRRPLQWTVRIIQECVLVNCNSCITRKPSRYPVYKNGTS